MRTTFKRFSVSFLPTKALRKGCSTTTSSGRGLITTMSSSRLATLASRLAFHAYTMFLFSKSDVKTTVVPVSFFAMGTAPLSSSHRASHAIQCVLWVWLHVLQFNLSNQIRDPEEDRVNKPWRPLPSGRLTLANAVILKYIATAACLLLSYSYSNVVFMSSAFLSLLIPMYHELHGDQHWLSKNLMNAIGYVCFSTGSTLIAAADRRKLDFPGTFSIIVIAAILATTIQAQDFQDVIGDKAVGRYTLPIAFPNFSRYTPLITLVVWSLYLAAIWEVSTPACVGFTLLAIIVGIRYYFWRSAKDDEWSYFLYNIWLAIAFALPGYWRMYRENAVQ